MLKSLAALALAAALAGTTGFAQATPVLDQSNLGPVQGGGGIGRGVSGDPIVAQTFTVGIAGELSSVAFAATALHIQAGTLIAEIRTTAAGVPTGTVLASVALLPAQVPDTIPGNVGAGDLTSIDLSAFDIQVNVGDQLAITLSELDPNLFVFGWAGTNNDAYAGGGFYFNLGSGFTTLQGLDHLDLLFQTFVDAGPQDPQAVPEPTSFALAFVALAALGLATRRQKCAGSSSAAFLPGIPT